MTDAAIAVRVLGPPDAAAFQALRLAGLREAPSAFTASPEEEEHLPLTVVAGRLAGSEVQRVFGAFAGAELVGIVTTCRETRRKTRHRAVLQGVYVKASHRGLGVARALLSTALDHLDRSPGVQTILLAVTVGNQPALALYEALGFRSYGTAPAALLVDGQLHDEIQMARAVPPRTTNEQN